MIPMDGKIDIQLTLNSGARTDKSDEVFPTYLTRPAVEPARKFHALFDAYSPTPLISLSNLACEFGVRNILVKDESHRFGLNAFKGLGGAYAIGKIISRKAGLDIGDLTLKDIRSETVRKKTGKITFTSVTAGNHGKGVAWAARQMGHHARIYLPKGSPPERILAIQQLGGEAVDTGLDYTESLDLAKNEAQKNGWQLLQDVAWEGYTQIPKWVMQGYITMILEAQEQMAAIGIKTPTHIILQAGAGTFAAAIIGFYANTNRGAHLTSIVVEPECCDNIFRSAVSGDTTPMELRGDFANRTMMTSLACGVAPSMAWDILRNFVDGFAGCPDYVSAQGMRIYANPLGNDERMIAGEASGLGMGLFSLLMIDQGCDRARKNLGLNKDAQVLLINSEGDTSPENYRNVLWGGKYPLL